ncbi:hemerythrin domain-containing protein [Pontibacter russatus]|uniref:hemerythrin domain-containing protein n=1 Tax=Pontibacter russatus TaxID=2694929 RepID=UPI00137B4EEF|nr:hemerythrin domain-containing protein [Pontibacter russatus]
MKRHESLAPISRQHQEGLLAARLLQHGAPPFKGMPTTPPGKRDHILGLLQRHLKPHFKLEEETVFALSASLSEDLRRQTEELQAEHRQLEALILALPRIAEDLLPDKLHEAGKLLEQHIRKEERVFFEQVQGDMTEQELQQLQEMVALHMH